MIGDLIARIRCDKNVSKTDLSKATNINVGHLTHIEKGERNPSHKALRSLCQALDVPYQPLMYTYDRELSDDQVKYNAPFHVRYDSIPIISSIDGFAHCSSDVRNATFVLRVNGNDMAPKLPNSSFVYVELNAPLNSKDIGIFEVGGRIIIRKFIVRKNDIVLRANSEFIDDIVLTKNSNFSVIGKVLKVYQL